MIVFLFVLLKRKQSYLYIHIQIIY